MVGVISKHGNRRLPALLLNEPTARGRVSKRIPAHFLAGRRAPSAFLRWGTRGDTLWAHLAGALQRAQF